MSIAQLDLPNRLQLAVQSAVATGKRTLEYFQRADLAVDRKSDDSPVTIADRQAEQLLREAILAAYPDDGFIGEEFGEVKGSSELVWVVDPIDGTKSFICGVPTYSTLIGLLWRGESVAGVIHLPALDECVFAAKGVGAFFRFRGRERPARVSDRVKLASGVFLTSQVDSFAKRGASGVFDALQQRASITRTWGDGYGYSLVATGRADVMVDPEMHLWDAAAIQPILQEAGGTFTDWQGNPSVSKGEGIATNGHMLEEVLEITRSYPRRS